MNVIITGATGMVGKGVLLECLDHEEVEKVLVIGRNRLMFHIRNWKNLSTTISPIFQPLKSNSPVTTLVSCAWVSARLG